MSATVRRFLPEQQLLHLALHMRKHRYVGLRWLADVAELLRRFQETLDWRYLVTTARAAGLQTLLYTGISLAREYFDAPCPTEPLHALTPSAVRRRLLQSVLTQDALMTPVEMDDAGWTHLAPAEVLLLDKPSAMARELRYRLFPPADRLAGPDRAGNRMSLYASRLVQRTTTLLRR
ncbi:MAG: nucleotidyltransferase family protein [Caldilineales bacterium]